MERHGLSALLVVLVIAALLLGCGLLPTSSPEIQFAARDRTVAPGECTILEWEVQGAEGYPVFLNGEEVDSSDWEQVCPEETATYELVVGAPGGPYEERVTVELEGEPTSGPEPLLSPTSLPPTTLPATPTTPPSVSSPTTPPPTPTTPPPPPTSTSPAPPPTPTSTSTPVLHALELINNSGQTIWYVYFSLSTSSEWGDDQLGSTTVQPGHSRVWQVPPGTYDLKAEDSAHNIVDVRYSQNIVGPFQWVIAPVALPGNLVLTNNSGQTICFVYISLSTDSVWGSDQLAAGEKVEPGQSRPWEVPPGTYDLKAEDCGHNVLDTRFSINLAAPYQWTIS